MTAAAGVANRFLPRVERHEVRRVALAALSFVCLAAGALIARAAGDALFLEHFGSGSLPNMYIAGGIATGLGTFACLWASRRLATGRIAIAVAGLLLFMNVALFASFGVFPAVSRAGAYLLADVTVRIPFFLFWALASEIFDARESRRLFGLIGAAGTAACLPAGLLVGPLARTTGVESLVLVTAALMGGFLFCAAALVRGQKRQAGSAGSLVTGGTESARRLLLSPQFVSIAGLAVMTSLVSTVVDYQFKTAAAATVSSTALADLFGSLYATTSIVSLFLQLLVVHRLLAAAGIFGSLCVLPGALLLTQAGVFRFRTDGWVFAAKGLDITLSTTINGTARQLLFRGVRPESRLTARALVDGLFLPLAIGVAGAGLGLISGLVSIPAAVAAAAAGFVIWIFLARRAYTAYVSGLLDALKARRFGFSDEPLMSSDPALRVWLRGAFESASDEDLIYLAAVLPQIGRMVGPAPLKAALARENPKLKVAILQSLRTSGLKEGPELAASLSRHGDPEVRRAAVLAAGSTGRRAEWLNDALADPEPRVRAAAAASFANAENPQVRLLGWERLGAMIKSEDPLVRAAAAEALEHVEDPSAAGREIRTRLLGALLEDRDDSVVLAALETVRSRQHAELALPVLALLGRPVLSGAASDALVAMGPAVIDPVIALFEGPPESRRDAILAKVPQVLERIGDPRGLAVISRMLALGRPEERSAVYRSYVQFIGRERAEGAPVAEIDALVAQECRAAAARLSSMRRLGRTPAVRLARDAVSDLVACHVENAFILLSGRIRNVDMMVLHGKITRSTGEERSHALELLENLLPAELRAPLLAILEPAGEGADTEPAAEVLELLLERESEWVVAGAAWAAADLALVACAGRLLALKGHESPVVRETALFALERLGGAA
jgi:AAA family ATP:ADP antiporter